MIDLDAVLLIGAIVLIAAIFAARVGAKFGLPALLLFLGIGMVLGDSVIGIHFDNAEVAQAIGFGALVLILAEGGLTTKWGNIKSSTGVAVTLATGGVAVSVATVGLFGYLVLGLDPWVAILLGAVTSPTDAAAVFAVLRRVPLPHKIRGMLEAESGLNDAPTVLVVTLASAAAAGNPTHGGVPVMLLLIIVELLGGLAIGAALGWIGIQILRRINLPSSGLYALAALGWTVLAFAVAGQVHTSGFAAVYVCGLLIGNAKLPFRMATRSFVEGIGWIAQIGLFVMLGLLSSPHRIDLSDVGIALAAGFFLTLIARPLSVFLSTVWFKIGWRDQIFLSWAGLRGAVPIVLCTIPLATGVPDATKLFDVVLIFVIVFTVLQGPTLPWVASRLGLTDRAQATDVEVEVAPLERVSADLLQVKIPAGSKLSGVEIGELRLGKNAAVSLIIRGDVSMVPAQRERLRVGDEILIVTPSHLREQTERRLRAIGRGGRLAAWRTTDRDGTEDLDEKG
ncbi:potassium/proton antiporter [Microlunatus soli]|uniref:Cell volume regulation protein A n=1 Tax=Microlunatus soli TaxID=630515 RepID=A0A1H1T629_9ACTN|nr:potassium/proton antiporter [Microlunatus soli]SDS55624.1 cell volume regulation protein A [Microlunatus soli]